MFNPSDVRRFLLKVAAIPQEGGAGLAYLSLTVAGGARRGQVARIECIGRDVENIHQEVVERLQGIAEDSGPLSAKLRVRVLAYRGKEGGPTSYAGGETFRVDLVGEDELPEGETDGTKMGELVAMSSQMRQLTGLMAQGVMASGQKGWTMAQELLAANQVQARRIQELEFELYKLQNAPAKRSLLDDPELKMMLMSVAPELVTALKAALVKSEI